MLRKSSTLGFKMLNTGAQDLIVDRPLWKYLEEKEFVGNNVLTTFQRDTNRITSAQIYYCPLFSASLHSSNLHAKPLEKNNNTRHAPQSSRSLFTESLASQAVECYSPSPTLERIRHVYFGQVFRLALKQSNQTLTPMLLWTQFTIPLSRNLS